MFGQFQDKSIFDNQLWVQTGLNPQQMSSYSPLNNELAQANPNPPGYADFVNPKNNPNNKVTGWKVEMPIAGRAETRRRPRSEEVLLRAHPER